MTSEWISVKKKMPPYGLVVEAFVDERMNAVRLNHVARIKDDESGDFWTLDGLDEGSWGGKDSFKIKKWRYLQPLPNGRTAWFLVNKRGYFVTVFKKAVFD